jgi:thymidylate kinase
MLLDGTTLVVDRYVYSGVAFTAAKVSEEQIEMQ